LTVYPRIKVLLLVKPPHCTPFFLSRDCSQVALLGKTWTARSPCSDLQVEGSLPLGCWDIYGSTKAIPRARILPRGSSFLILINQVEYLLFAQGFHFAQGHPFPHC
jgi:hypothetical protein